MSLFRKRSIKGDPHAEYQCTIRFLDDAEPIVLTFKKDTLGHVLFDQVCNKLNLVEKDYFGLRYVDSEKQRHWLDPLKSVYKQLKGVNPTVLCFRVKFYPAEPMKLREEITRYHLFLQLRRDLHHGRLLCSPADANLLAAYIIQSEVGDYEIEDHHQGYVTEFKMLPKQNVKMEEQIMELHKTLRDQVPAEAEGNFLKKAASLDTYGVDPHQVKDHKGTQLYLGVTHQGIMTFHGSRRTQLYKWSQIRRIVYEGKMFIVHVNITEEEDASNTKKSATLPTSAAGYLCTQAGAEEDKQQPIGYKCQTVGACKYLWRCAVEQQLFFTLPDSLHPPKLRSGGSLFTRGSRFRFSGRCQNEAYDASKDIKRDEPNFSRSSSLPNFTRKSDSKPSLKYSNILNDTVKEDKKQGYRESPIDVQNLDTKPTVGTIPVSPSIKAPVASEEEINITPDTEEPVQSAFIAQTESAPPKANGSIPSAALDTSNMEAPPPYSPNNTMLEEIERDIITNIAHDDDNEDEEDNAKNKLSLDEQIKSLEEEIQKKETMMNHVQPEVQETVDRVECHAEPQENKSPVTPVETASPPAVVKKGGVSCCRVMLFTFIFILLTLTVVTVVIVNSNINHPLAKQLRQHFKFIDPVRDFITKKAQKLFRKS